MGRELKRVPLDFDWPINKVWEGFINPHYSQCAHCNGGGNTKARRLLQSHTKDLMWERTDDPEYVALTEGLAGRAKGGLIGHDSCDAWSAEEKVIKAAGLDPETWGICQHCGGEGDDPSTREAAEAWEETQPPAGDGYQIWETVSEGSPISPVFAEPEKLAAWMAGCKWGADHGTSAEQWLRFINGPGWAPTLISDSKHGVRTGVQAMPDNEGEQ